MSVVISCLSLGVFFSLTHCGMSHLRCEVPLQTILLINLFISVRGRNIVWYSIKQCIAFVEHGLIAAVLGNFLNTLHKIKQIIVNNRK